MASVDRLLRHATVSARSSRLTEDEALHLARSGRNLMAAALSLDGRGCAVFVAAVRSASVQILSVP